jgi:hypothetical protein
MIFKPKNITFQDLIEHDFVFTSMDIPDDYVDYIFNLPLDKNDHGEEISQKIHKFNCEADCNTKLLLKNLPVEQKIKDDLMSFEYGLDKYKKGDWMQMHSDRGRINPYELLFWLCKNDDAFEGRDFIMKTPLYEARMRPNTGLFCFVNNIMPLDILHGVSPLLNDEPVITIFGTLGGKDYDRRLRQDP